jgi:predicted dehydrogenase
MTSPVRSPRSPSSLERVGILGAGAAARLHLRALSRISGLRIVGIRDVQVQRAAALAAEFNLPPEVADPARFYEVLPESVHVVAPPAAHEELAMQALQRGAHVLVEKPPALTLAGCERLMVEAGRRGLAIGVNENTAMDPLIRRARLFIEAGRLGRLLQIDGFYSFGLREGETPPAWMDQMPGGMLEDLLPHLLTTARALAGVQIIPEHWRLGATGRVPGQHDELRLLLSGGDGLSVSVALSLTTRPKAFTLVVRGTRATLAIDLRNMLLHVSRPDTRGGAVAAGAELIRSSLGTLWQTTCNAAGVIAGRRELHGSFLHLIRAHYAALRATTILPTPLQRSTDTIAITRQIWPIAEEPRAAHGRTGKSQLADRIPG